MGSPHDRARGRLSRKAAAVLVSLLALNSALAAGCGSSPSTGDDRAGGQSTTPQEATTMTDTTGADPTEPDPVATTTDGSDSGSADPDRSGLGQALVVVERERGDLVLRELVSEAPDLAAGTGREVELTVGQVAEDRRDRQVLVLTVPTEPLGRPDGHYVLTVAPAGPEPLVVRRATLSAEGAGVGSGGGSPVAVVVEARSGSAAEGRWAFGLSPRMRPVVVSGDDPADGIETQVVQAADFGVEPVAPAVTDIGDGWSRLTFELPVWLTDQAPAAAACERVLDRLDADLGGGRPWWPEADADEAALERAAAATEQQDLESDRRIDLTLDIGGREIVRGQRLQPLVRYPVTVVAADGSGRAATLGCSISLR